MKTISLKKVYAVGVISLSFILSPYDAIAQESPWIKGNRIAVSSDGNPNADRDDIGATPMTLAVLAKAKLQNNLVHYDFNNWLEYKKINKAQNNMWVGAMGGAARWGFDMRNFFDVSSRPYAAINNLRDEINKSTATNPLYIIVGGPVELIYRAMRKAEKSRRAHVSLVTHSGYNDYYKPRLWQHDLDDILKLHAKIKVLRIPDQNQGLRTKDDNNKPNFSPWEWLNNHLDPNLRWVFQRMKASKVADVSDTGMLTWLIKESGSNSITTVTELKDFFGRQLIDTNGGSANRMPAIPAGKTPKINLPITEHVFEEEDGRIVIEAETVPLNGAWKIESSESDYSGTGYIRYVPEEGLNVKHSKSRGVLIYKLRITNPGKYRMALRHSHYGAPSNDDWNYVHTLMGIDVAPFGILRNTFHSTTQDAFEEGVGFTFDTTHNNYGVIARNEGKYTQPMYELTAGDHYFFVSGSSGGYRLDKIHIFKQGVSGFKDNNYPQTRVEYQ